MHEKPLHLLPNDFKENRSQGHADGQDQAQTGYAKQDARCFPYLRLQYADLSELEMKSPSYSAGGKFRGLIKIFHPYCTTSAERMQA